MLCTVQVVLVVPFVVVVVVQCHCGFCNCYGWFSVCKRDGNITLVIIVVSSWVCGGCGWGLCGRSDAGGSGGGCDGDCLSLSISCVLLWTFC